MLTARAPAAPQAVDGTFCSEMDILEANTKAQQYTTHACVDACGSYSGASECKGNGSPSVVWAACSTFGPEPNKQV